ncbi:MAG: hypothetical protein EBV02_04295, partial [Actinobacteria bacterium]|nr:hypothetical protein [Actinomycetota bacterium]
VWVGLGLAFTGVIAWMFAGQGEGGSAAVEYLSAYLIEKSLSVDNVFVWAVVFSHFAVPRQYQHRTLFWGIFGALIMRFIFILVGTAVINRFKILLLVFGVFLVYTGWKIVSGKDEESDPNNSKTMRLFRRFIPSIDQTGVGELVEMAAKRGRKAKRKLKLGVCGEHGGDPESIGLFYRAGLDYVSCSPYRIPIARLAAAQAIIGGAKSDTK